MHSSSNFLLDVIGPSLVVYLFTQNQVGSIAFKLGELPG